MATKKMRAAAVAAMEEQSPEVTLAPALVARINQMAHREGKAHADMWRSSTTLSLKTMAEGGASFAEISSALATIEADPAGALAEGNRQRMDGKK